MTHTATAPAAPADVTYSAHLSSTDDGLELIVRRDVYAGVCGPFLIETLADDTALEAIDVLLARYGLAVDGRGWVTGRRFGALILTAGVEQRADGVCFTGQL